MRRITETSDYKNSTRIKVTKSSHVHLLNLYCQPLRKTLSKYKQPDRQFHLQILFKIYNLLCQ